MGYLTHLECALCGRAYDAGELQRLCADCARPLLARYDLEAARARGRDALVTSEPTMWRYQALLPVEDKLSLGEGFTPNRHRQPARLERASGIDALVLDIQVTQAEHHAHVVGSEQRCAALAHSHPICHIAHR